MNRKDRISGLSNINYVSTIPFSLTEDFIAFKTLTYAMKKNKLDLLITTDIENIMDAGDAFNNHSRNNVNRNRNDVYNYERYSYDRETLYDQIGNYSETNPIYNYGEADIKSISDNIEDLRRQEDERYDDDDILSMYRLTTKINNVNYVLKASQFYIKQDPVVELKKQQKEKEKDNKDSKAPNAKGKFDNEGDKSPWNNGTIALSKKLIDSFLLSSKGVDIGELLHNPYRLNIYVPYKTIKNSNVRRFDITSQSSEDINRFLKFEVEPYQIRYLNNLENVEKATKVAFDTQLDNALLLKLYNKQFISSQTYDELTKMLEGLNLSNIPLSVDIKLKFSVGENHLNIIETHIYINLDNLSNYMEAYFYSYIGSDSSYNFFSEDRDIMFYNHKRKAGNRIDNEKLENYIKKSESCHQKDIDKNNREEEKDETYNKYNHKNKGCHKIRPQHLKMFKLFNKIYKKGEYLINDIAMDVSAFFKNDFDNNSHIQKNNNNINNSGDFFFLEYLPIFKYSLNSLNKDYDDLNFRINDAFQLTLKIASLESKKIANTLSAERLLVVGLNRSPSTNQSIDVNTTSEDGVTTVNVNGGAKDFNNTGHAFTSEINIMYSNFLNSEISLLTQELDTVLGYETTNKPTIEDQDPNTAVRHGFNTYLPLLKEVGYTLLKELIFVYMLKKNNEYNDTFISVINKEVSNGQIGVWEVLNTFSKVFNISIILGNELDKLAQEQSKALIASSSNGQTQQSKQQMLQDLQEIQKKQHN